MLSTCSFVFPRRAKVIASPSPDNSTNSLILDRSKCISCGMCVKACKKVAGQSVLVLAKDPKYPQKRVSTRTGNFFKIQIVSNEDSVL